MRVAYFLVGTTDEVRQEPKDILRVIEASYAIMSRLSQFARGIAQWVGQRQNRTSRSKIFVELSGNLFVAVGPLHDEQGIGAKHFGECPLIGHEGPSFDEGLDPRASGDRAKKIDVYRSAKANAKRFRRRYAAIDQVAEAEEKLRGV